MPSPRIDERSDEPGAPVVMTRTFVVDPDGRRVPEEAVVQHLRFARVTRLSLEANAGFCRGVLAARYKDAAGVDKEEATL